MATEPHNLDLANAFAPLIDHYSQRIEAGMLVYPQGEVTETFYLVLSGRVVFEIVNASGARAVVQQALPGDSFGHVSTFSGRPTSAAATTAEPTILLAVPEHEAAEAFRLAPELALSLIYQFAGAGQSRRLPSGVESPIPAALEPILEAARKPEAIGEPDAVGVPDVPAPELPPSDDHTIDPEFNPEWFFKDDTVCPACDTKFDYLRVRIGAVRPVARTSDFHSTYRTVDPLSYAVTVCPHCSFAAYAEEFGDVSAGEREALDEHRASRERLRRPNLCGERDLDGAATSLDLAIACYEVRAAGDRRRAGLLHRRAWIERTRGDEPAERVFLQQAVGAYRAAFEADSTINDTAAVRAAYLIGDLYMRLDDLTEASRWLASCLEMGGDGQSGIMRMAREQMHACRVRLEQRDKGAA